MPGRCGIARIGFLPLAWRTGFRAFASTSAKGLAERVVLYKHALRNAVLPVITVLGLQFGNVMAGAILVETVFNWPGLGRLAFEAVLRRDYPTVLGVLLFASVVVLVMNQLTDLAYRLVDPRIKAR